MRKTVWSRLLALLLVLSMFATPVSAAGKPGSKNPKPGTSTSAAKEDKKAEKEDKKADKKAEKEDKKNNKDEKPTKPTQPTKPTEPVVEETEPVVEETEPVVEETVAEEEELTLIEGASNVDNGTLLRASTFSLRSAEADEVVPVYFPVTMFDYDQDTINTATDEKDDDLTVREGMYFSGGAPAYEKSQGGTTIVNYTVEDDMVVIPDGTYLLYCTDTSYYVTDSININSPWTTTVLNGTTANNVNAATEWTFERQNDGSYTIQNADGKYLTITGSNSGNLSDTENTVKLSAIAGSTTGITLYDDDGAEYGYMNSLGATSYSRGYFGGWSAGSSFCLYELIEAGKIVSGYEEWNRWDKASGDNANGDLIYTGLVQDTLVDDQIVFNVPEGGIFDNNTQVKKIYEYVGLPFVLDSDTGVYTFDSDANGVYFEGAPTSGTGPADGEMRKLLFKAGETQLMNEPVGDGSLNAWFPFNGLHSSEYSAWNGPTNQNETFGRYDPAIDYHFGMRADIPFSLTPNGRVKSTDDESAPISFTFSGDDDVWVFIDGQLVVDLGGIHNRLDVTIDFAANTVTYYEKNAQDQNNETGSYNDSTFATVQKLFAGNESEGSGAGLINMSREAFALDQDHEMEVFYLERGEGTSNCRITFNLPMTDTVIVTKDATKSWSQEAENADLEADPKADDPGVEDLTSTEQAAVDNINFGFTLYKKTANDAGFAPVANTNYYLVGKGVTDVTINQTDANGHFYLKNGQSAKFITDIPSDGVTYYVVEDQVPAGFIAPDFNYAGKAVYDYEYTGNNNGVNESGTAPAQDASLIPEQIIPMPTENEDGTLTWAENKSYEVTVSGSVEAQDSIEFICSNYLDAELPNPTALAYEDIIVIDYGLPVKIDPLANDVFRGESIEIVYAGGEDVELTTTTGADGKVSATWTEDSTLNYGTMEPHDVTYAAASGDQEAVRDTLTYTLNKQLTEVEVLSYIIKVTGKEAHEATGEVREQYSYALAKVYIVPATTMYYEENFTDLVTFKGSGWQGPENTDGHSDYQEPGVVGMGYSTYGSDVAYLSDSFDSNGTSYRGDTTNGAIQFSYTFTGTGTSIFARTSATTGYMQVKLYEGTDTATPVKIHYRDTYYKDENGLDDDSDGTLYNIPVYTEESLDYGTYTMVVTIAKKGAKTGNPDGAGNEFYLDGIRIMEPLDDHVLYLDDEFLAQQDENGLAQIEAEQALVEKALGAYATDGEANMESVTLRYKLIGDAEEGVNDWGFVVFTDIEGTVDNVEDYITIGPKEEVYLLPGQSVTFAIEYWHQDGYLMHLGMKAPFGTGTAQVGNTTFNLQNAADCYYNITGMHSGVLTKYEQLVEKDMLVYVDQYNNRIFEDAEGHLFDADDKEVTDEELELTPVDDITQPYYVATYTIKAVDKIVSLTKLKVTGNYRFHVNRDVDIEINGSEGSGADGEGH